MSMGRCQFTVVDSAGNVVPGAHIEVRREVPGQPLAGLYSDRAGTVPLGNPFDADADGFAYFHVAGGAFQVRAYTGASGAPTFERIWRYVPVGLLQEQDAGIGSPLVVYVDGQSHTVIERTLAWSPNVNARRFNNTLDTVDTGSSFQDISNTTVNLGDKIASDIADAYPNRSVYVIINGFSGMAISHWLSGTGAPDAYANGVANVEVALDALGVSKIDLYVDVQGEGDTGPLNGNYIVNHATKMSRYWAESWFPRETPVLIFGIASTAIGGNSDADNMNDYRLGIVGVDPDKRKFVSMATFPAAYWEANPGPDQGHMLATGYFALGALAAHIYLGHAGSAHLPRIVVDRATGNVMIGTSSASGAPFAVSANAATILPNAIGTSYLVGANAAAALQAIDAFAGFAGVIGRRSNGTLASPSALAGNDLIATYGAQGHDGSSYAVGNRAALNFFALGDWTASNHGTYASIFNTPSGSTSPAETHRFQNGSMRVFGTTSGSITFAVPAVAGSNTITWPAGTTDFSATGGASRVVKQTTAGGAFTVAVVAVGDVSGFGTGVATFLATPSSANLAAALTDETGSGAAVFATSPTLVTPTLGDAIATTLNGVTIDNNAWTTYTVTVTATSGTFTVVSATARYKRFGKTIFLQIYVTITTAGTAVGQLKCTLPVNAAAQIYAGIAKETALTGKSGACQIIGTTDVTIVQAIDSTGTTFIASGGTVNFGITYETA